MYLIDMLFISFKKKWVKWIMIGSSFNEVS